MRLNFEGGHITISDESETAQKIKAGYDFEIIKGEVIIKTIPAIPKNKWQFGKKIREAKSLEEIKELVAKFIEEQ